MTVLRSKLTIFLLTTAILIATIIAVKATPSEAQSAELTVHAHADYAYNTNNRRLIVGDAKNVFIGKVVKQVGAKDEHMPGSEIVQPWTQFAVSVKENIKGEVAKKVVVSQFGGHVEYTATADAPEVGVKKGQRVKAKVLVNGDQILTPGEEYVFSTTSRSEEGWYSIAVSNAGDVKIHGKKDFAQKKAEYEKAKKNQKDPAKLH